MYSIESADGTEVAINPFWAQDKGRCISYLEDLIKENRRAAPITNYNTVVLVITNYNAPITNYNNGGQIQGWSVGDNGSVAYNAADAAAAATNADDTTKSAESVYATQLANLNAQHEALKACPASAPSSCLRPLTLLQRARVAESDSHLCALAVGYESQGVGAA